MNKIILSGRLTKNPTVNSTQGQNPMTFARYTLAVDRPKRSGEQQSQADFINCVVFGKAAEFVQNYLHQGTKVLITGRLQTGKYTNQNGQTVYTTDVVVESHEFMESKNQQSNGQPQQNPYPQPNANPAPQANYPQAPAQNYQQPQQNSQPYQQQNPPFNGTDFMSIPDGIDDDLPFN